jgi:AcrR family transcriptional regulator
LKKVPRDLWAHPRYAGKSQVIERSTGTTDISDGTKIALAMLSELERDFSAARRELAGIGTRPHTIHRRPSAAAVRSVSRPNNAPIGSRSKSRVGEATKRESLMAALKEFAEKGLKGARVDDIAAKTRTTKPMIYYHFGSKRELLSAVAHSLYRSLESLSEEGEWHEQVRGSFRQLHDLVQAHPNAAALLLREITQSPVARERSRSLLRALSKAGLASDGRSALLGNLIALVIGHGQLAAWEGVRDDTAPLLRGETPRDEVAPGDGLFEAGLEALIAAYAPA